MPSNDLKTLSVQLLGKSYDDLDPEEKRVLASIHGRNPVSRDAGDVSDERASFGERLSEPDPKLS
jgi:hypothetical protein